YTASNITWAKTSDDGWTNITWLTLGIMSCTDVMMVLYERRRWTCSNDPTRNFVRRQSGQQRIAQSDKTALSHLSKHHRRRSSRYSQNSSDANPAHSSRSSQRNSCI